MTIHNNQPLQHGQRGGARGGGGSRGAFVWRRWRWKTRLLQVVAGLPELQPRPYGREGILQQPLNDTNRQRRSFLGADMAVNFRFYVVGCACDATVGHITSTAYY